MLTSWKNNTTIFLHKNNVDYSSTNSRRSRLCLKERKQLHSKKKNRMRKCTRKALDSASLGERMCFSKKERKIYCAIFCEHYFVLLNTSRDDFYCPRNQNDICKHQVIHSSNICILVTRRHLLKYTKSQ